MIQCNKFEFTQAGRRKQLHPAAFPNRSRLVFVAYTPHCTMRAKGTLVSPIRYGEILEHICKELQGFILIFIAKKVSRKSKNIWTDGFNLLKTKDKMQFAGKLWERKYCSLMARQLHV